MLTNFSVTDRLQNSAHTGQFYAKSAQESIKKLIELLI